MGPLDNMLSQYTSYRQPQNSTPVAAAPSTPGRPGYNISAEWHNTPEFQSLLARGLVDPPGNYRTFSVPDASGRSHELVSPSAPNSYYAAAAAPTGFGSGPPDVTAGGFSKGSSPFGVGIPDLSKADPTTIARLQKGMEGLIYEGIAQPGGGYIHGDYGSKPGEKYGPYYKGQPPASDPSANAAAKAYYNYIGSLPTRPIGTQALNSLPGYSPTPGPSYNSNSFFGSGGYGGPFTFPGYDPSKQYRG